MAPARDVPTSTIAAYTDVTAITAPATTATAILAELAGRDTWPTNTFVTLTWPDAPATAVVDAAATPTWTYTTGTGTGGGGGLSNGAKGAIAGSIIGAAFLLLLLYCWCQRPQRARSASRRRRQFIKVPLPPKDPADPPEPKKKKKSVTISPDSKDPKDPEKYRLNFPPLVKFTTDMTATTTIDIRESKRGSPLPFFIRPLERAKTSESK